MIYAQNEERERGPARFSLRAGGSSGCSSMWLLRLWRRRSRVDYQKHHHRHMVMVGGVARHSPSPGEEASAWAASLLATSKLLLLVEINYLVDPASSHMLVSKTKPCMCKY